MMTLRDVARNQFRETFTFDHERQIYSAFADYGHYGYGRAAVALLIFGRCASVAITMLALYAIWILLS